MALELNPISVTKDDQSIKAFEFDNKIVAPAPIPQLIQVDFPGLNSNEVGKFTLSDSINFDLLVKSFELDLKHDDADSIAETQYHSGNTPLVFFLIDPTTQKLVRKVTAQVSGYPIQPFYFVFKHDLQLQVKAAAGFNSLTFYCEPIHITNTVTATYLDR